MGDDTPLCAHCKKRPIKAGLNTRGKAFKWCETCLRGQVSSYEPVFLSLQAIGTLLPQLSAEEKQTLQRAKTRQVHGEDEGFIFASEQLPLTLRAKSSPPNESGDPTHEIPCVSLHGI